MTSLDVVYNIPYRRAPRLAFRPSASREQRYIICILDAGTPNHPHMT